MAHFTSLRSTSILAATAAAMLGLAMPVHAALTVYTDAAIWQAAVVSSTSINFDDLPDNTPLAGQYPGVSFSPFIIGNPLVAAYSFPQSPSNVVSIGDPTLRGPGDVAMDFTQQQRGIGFWYLDSQFKGNMVTVYGAGKQELGSYEMAYPHPVEWLFVGFIDSGSNIRRVTVASAPDDMIALDSLQLAPVPEPASVALMLGGLVAVCAVRRRRTASHAE